MFLFGSKSSFKLTPFILCLLHLYFALLIQGVEFLNTFVSKINWLVRLFFFLFIVWLQLVTTVNKEYPANHQHQRILNTEKGGA